MKRLKRIYNYMEIDITQLEIDEKKKIALLF